MKSAIVAGLIFSLVVLIGGCAAGPSATSQTPTQASSSPSIASSPTPAVTPTHYSIALSSGPTGAEIWLNRTDTGHITPYKFRAELGEHTVVFKLDGYIEREERIKVVDQDTSFFVTLDKIPPTAEEIAAKEAAEAEALRLKEEAEAERVAAEAEKIAQQEADFKASAQEIEYKVFKKSPDKFIGTVLTYTGHVVQIMEDSGITFIRLEVTDLGYDIWTDVVGVFFDGGLDVYDDDIITVWGKGRGTYTYTSQANYNITIPSMTAWYVEK